MPHMSLQSLHLFGHGVEVFSIILLPRGLHSPKSGTDSHEIRKTDRKLRKKFAGIRKKFGSIRSHLKGLTCSVILLGNRIISGENAANINVLHSQDIRHSVRVA